MQQRKSKKILIYFFLLILVGSINNINLSDLKLHNINDINIIGLDIKDKSILLKKIKNTQFILSSSLYSSSPLGPEDQPDFINAVFAILTQLNPHELLNELQKIEKKQKRNRKNLKRLKERSLKKLNLQEKKVKK